MAPLDADPRDAVMSGELVIWEGELELLFPDLALGNRDLLLPGAVRDWLDETSMFTAHGAWHGLRQCDNPRSFLDANICDDFPSLVSAHQECADAQDGYNFLVMHRHMLQAMRQRFPRHTQLFAGFAHFPFEARDVPVVWRDRFGNGWSAEVVQSARILENIENELGRFPTEGALGQFIQCGSMNGLFAGNDALHPAMHQKWNVAGSPAPLDDFYANLGNAMFWQLHDWVDRVWERYRAAKRLAPDQPSLVQALSTQCREMHLLARTFSQ